MQKIAIIIPCYNQQNPFDEVNIETFLSQTAVDIHLAKDGSTNETLKKITAVSSANNLRCFVDYKVNEGKASTVFKTVNYISNNGNYEFIGYLDADFSTPVSEIVRMITSLEENPPTFLFGSQIKLLNSNIDRKVMRHIVGRIIITILNLKFKLGIYDTQCGAKFFNREAIKNGFSKKLRLHGFLTWKYF